MPGSKPVPFEERFWPKVDIRGDDDCWVWLAGLTKGYGQFSFNGQGTTAHRIAFLLTYGYMPEEVDHLCQNTLCQNPRHLEDVTHAENNRRIGERSTHCRKGGHPWTEESTMFVTVNGVTRRECNECRKARKRANYRRKKEQECNQLQDA